MPHLTPNTAPANDAVHSADEEIRGQLRKDHEEALAELDSLRGEKDERRCQSRLRHLRQAWVIHALAEETVVYRALESAASSERADERFIEHELVGNVFDKLMRVRPGTLEWKARVNVLGELMRRHIESEHDELFTRLGDSFDAEALRSLGEQFRSAHRKLTLLENAKAA